MTQISVSELKANAGKYVSMAVDQDILITKNGKIIAKLVTAKADKKEAFRHFLSLFPEQGLELNPEEIREERLRGRVDLK